MSFIFEIFLMIIFKYAFLPIIYILTSPFVILLALIKKGSITENAKTYFNKIYKFWMKWGEMFSP
jgi:polyferredoxin